MKIRNSLLVAMGVLLLAGPLSAASMTPEQTAWGKGPVQYLMTKQEMDQWKTIKTAEDAQKFIDLFWAKRDSDLAKPGNAVRERFEALAKYADEHFGFQRVAGSMTDRGKAMILLGPPTRIAKINAGSVGTVQSGPLQDEQGNLNDDKSPAETWTYEKEQIPAFMGKQELQVNFVDQFANGEYKLTRSRTNVLDAYKKAAASAIVHPELKEAPAEVMATAEPAPQQAPAVVNAAPQPVATAAPLSTTFKTEALKTAVTEFSSAKTNPYKKSYVTYGEFVTPKGEYFVPVELYVPSTAGVQGDHLTFFGQIQDKQGNPVAVYEEPATLQQSKYDWYYDKSLSLPAGQYTGIFGLASDGKPLTMAKTDMDLQPLNSADASVSRLIISNNLFPLSAAQKPDDPFAFGGIKVVPKGDAAFQNSDELWYFFELRNPGLDESGSPKVQVKVDVQGTTAKGKKVKMSAPMSPANAEPLKGVDGHFAVGSSIPLSSFEPGDYSMKLTVRDTVKGQSYTREQAFKVVEGTGK